MNVNKAFAAYLQSAKLILAGCAATLFLACIVPSCVGQNAPPQTTSAPVPLPASVQFVNDLKAISQRWKVAFVAEGQPQTVVSTVPSPALQTDTSLQDAINQIADYYDYTAVRKGHVFQLTRRYTSANDLPEVTREECRATFKAIAPLLTAYNPHYSPGDQFGSPYAHIAHLLTTQQLEALAKNGLPTTSLSADQKTEVWRVALYFYMQNQAKIIDYAADDMEQILQQNIVLRWQDVIGVHAFGFESTSGQPQKTTFMALSHTNQALFAVNGVPTFTSETTVNGVPVEEPDPSAPDGKVFEQDPFVAVSLASAVASLNERAQSKTTYRVDAGLASKHVTLVGAEQAEPSVIMNALAAIYSLRMLHQEDGSITLTRPRGSSVQDISHLGAAVRNTIPAPIVRAITARIQATRPVYKTAVPLPQRPFLESDYQSAAHRLREAALRKFRALVEPKVRNAKDQRLPLSALTEPERQLFVLAWAALPFAEACWLADRSVSPYVADFDHVVLTGGVYHDENNNERFSLFFSYPDPATGELHRGIGFTNARIPKE